MTNCDVVWNAESRTNPLSQYLSMRYFRIRKNTLRRFEPRNFKWAFVSSHSAMRTSAIVIAGRQFLLTFSGFVPTSMPNVAMSREVWQ
jgi:hypothetical protein